MILKERDGEASGPPKNAWLEFRMRTECKGCHWNKYQKFCRLAQRTREECYREVYEKEWGKICL